MTFGDFLDSVYLPAHKKPLTRYLHFVGTVGALGFIAAAIFVNPLWLIASPVWGYSWAWPAHWLVEGNTPATFRYPFQSLAGDLVMFGLWCVGALWANLAQSKQRYPQAWR